MSPEQIKQRFYELACDFSVNVGNNETFVSLEGLNENMPKALALLQDILKNAQADKEAYDAFVDIIIKSRADQKAEQQANFRALIAYGKFGKLNSFTNIIGNDELKTIDPQELVDKLKTLLNYKSTILYYGGDDTKTLVSTLNKALKGYKQIAIPVVSDYKLQSTSQNSILLAPYNAKNIYMIQYNNSNRLWTPENSAIIGVFNEYFGGSMNSVVFQELRETRGLAYSASAYYATPRKKVDPEYAQTYIITQNDKMMDCINAFNNIIDSIPQSQAAFDLAKQALKKRIATARTTKFGIINKYLEAQDLGLNYDINKTIYNNLDKVSLNDIVNFEKQTMANKPYLYIILGDEKELDIKALEKIAPIKRVSTEEIFGY